MPNDPVTVSISSQSVHPEEIARHSFPSARRGLDSEAVRRYLESLAAEMQLILDREQSIRRRVTELERAAAEPPTLDQQTILRAVGSETTKILETAHEAAAEVLARAEAEAADMLARAEAVLGERSATADEEATAILEEASTEAAAVSADAHDDAVALLEATRAECRRVVREARAVRGSVLADLTERRRELRVQLEQLRGGRDSLLEMFDAVGESVDEVRERLVNAEHEARLAAAEAGDVALTEEDDDVEVDDDGDERLDRLEVESIGLPVEGEEEDAGASDTEAGEAVALLTDEALAGELYDEEAPGEEHSEQRSRRSVDELFARIRSGRLRGGRDDEEEKGSSPSENGEGILESHSAHEAAQLEADGGEATAGGDKTGEDAGEREEAGEHDEEKQEGVLEADDPGDDDSGDDDPGDDDPGDGSDVSATGGEESEAAADVEGAAEPGPMETAEGEAFATRSSVLDPITENLSRALKRALRDDQNLLLDALRNAARSSDLSSLLPEQEQIARIEEAVGSLLGNAWSAGHSFLGGKKAPGKAAAAAGERLAADLAADLTALIRARLGQSLEASSESGDGAADAAGAAFREWRGSRIESTAADFTVRAFSEGSVTGGDGIAVRWIVDDEGRPCPDCEDNALAGSLGAGEEFPTGEVHPPVHPGCRCLLVPVTS